LNKYKFLTLSVIGLILILSGCGSDKNTSKSHSIKNETVASSQILTDDLFVKKFINKNNCDKILSNSGFFTTCYDYNLKGAKLIFAEIDGANVKKSIKKRPRFYEDRNLPKKYRTKYSDYTHSGFDRGHSGANDASFDYSLKAQKSTYVMSQIVPQYPKTNRKSYLKVEKYERKIASKLGMVHSLTLNEFEENPKRIGRSKLAVPSGTFKIYWNNDKEFKKCFYIPNDNEIYKLKEMLINCDEI
jgi:endonuclease G